MSKISGREEILNKDMALIFAGTPFANFSSSSRASAEIPPNSSQSSSFKSLQIPRFGPLFWPWEKVSPLSQFYHLFWGLHRHCYISDKNETGFSVATLAHATKPFIIIRNESFPVKFQFYCSLYTIILLQIVLEEQCINWTAWKDKAELLFVTAFSSVFNCS